MLFTTEIGASKSSKQFSWITELIYAPNDPVSQYSSNITTLLVFLTELNINSKTGLYNIKITNQNSEEIAFFKGTVFFSDKIWK